MMVRLGRGPLGEDRIGCLKRYEGGLLNKDSLKVLSI